MGVIENKMSEEEKKWKKLQYWLHKGDENEQGKALKKCINLLKQKFDEGKGFPDEKFIDLLKVFLSKKKDNTDLISKFCDTAPGVDIVFHFWRCIPRVLQKESQTRFYQLNFLHLVDRMTLPKNSEDPECIKGACLAIENEDEFKWNYDIVKRNMNKVWARTRGWNLSDTVHKKYLIVMVERMMPHLQNPILWTDLLMNSLNKEGSISFLALQAIYNLMTKFNIEVPHIYTKLYNMFQPEVFYSKFKPRLFYLADMFLSSTHLPESLVASFIKRISRLALIAPPEDTVIIIHLVCDLIIRHPGLKKMVDYPVTNKNSVETCPNDPFLEDESDPMKTKAIESSLWEIRSLERHILPSVSSISKYLKQPLPSVEFGIASRLEDNGGDIFDREIKRKVPSVALNFEPPKGMYLKRDDAVQQFWNL